MADNIGAWVHQEVGEARRKIHSYPKDAHWFCPAYGDEDSSIFDHPDEPDELTVSQKHSRIEEARERRHAAYTCCLLLGTDENDFEEAVAWKASFQDDLNRQLTFGCFECVREYHRFRTEYLKGLASKVGEEIAESFSELLNTLDFARIDTGLRKAKLILENTLELDRKQRVLVDQDPSTALALSEALCCDPYHTDEEHLSRLFDEVFAMVQTNKPLKLTEILPASTYFLFSDNEIRRKFAIDNWSRVPESISTRTFEWAVRTALRSNVNSMVRMYSPSAHDLEIFWGGLHSILSKVDQPLTRECLRNLELDSNSSIGHLLIAHFSTKSDRLFSLLIKSFCLILDKAPKDFYEVFGATSATQIVEQIFRSPSFSSLFDQPEDVEIDGLAAWVLPYIKSQPSLLQYRACDTLLHQLFGDLQTSPVLDESAKILCFQAGLLALSETVQTFLPDGLQISDPSTRAVVQDVLKLVVKYKESIFHCAVMQDPDQQELARLAMGVVKNTLKLDCKVIKSESELIRTVHDDRKPKANENFEVNLDSHSVPIWRAVLRAFTTNSRDMAQNILSGLISLIGIEEFKVLNKGGSLSKEMASFNASFATLSDIVASIFERLSDFQTADLRFLFCNRLTSFSMFGALVSSNKDISQAMAMVLLNYTGESTSKDALSKLLHDSETFGASLLSITWAIKQTIKKESFAPIPRLLKVSREILDGLCDTNGGVLRETRISTKDEPHLKNFWETQWALMTLVFDSLERWSSQPDTDKHEMAEFARNAMDQADALFDQYALLKSSLSKGSKMVLVEPLVKNIDSLVKWLRLKDPYLASILVNLLSKLLRRLGEEDVTIGRFALDYIRDCAVVRKGGNVKTNLTPQQKAELRRAVDQAEGLEMFEVDPRLSAPKKQGRLDSWSKSADGIKHEPSTVKSTPSRLGSSLTPTLNQHSSHIDQLRKKAADKLAREKGHKDRKTADSRAALAQNGLSIKESRERAKKEKQERDAAARAHARGLRTVPGEGSGMGVGVQGKDHTPKIESIMVDSSSDSESESDEDEEDIKARAALFKDKPSSAYAEIEAERRRQQVQGPVRKTKVVRSAKDMRARLSPNMDRLHHTILNWDFFHQGDVPPESTDCQMIANKFISAHEYKDTMYPLLVSEAWKDLVTIREEGKANKSRPFDIKIVNRMSVDNYIEITTTIFHQEMRDQDISDGSIVLLSQGQDPLRDESAPNCLARVFKTARTQHSKEKMDISYRVSNKVKSKIITALAPGAEIRGVNITTMTTIEREFAALHSLEYYDLCDEILNAKPSPLLKYHDSAITPIERNYKVNKAQAKAILSAKDNDAFTLIQGPPGSGKTKTIVAMVGAILTNTLVAQGTTITRPTQNSSNPAAPKAVAKKLLICAPSNAAVDEIVSRLKAGIKSMKGDFHKINVLRMGRLSTMNPNVQDVSLEKLIMARLDGTDEENKAMMEERAKREKLHKDAGELKQIVNELRSKLDAARTSGDKATEDELRRQLDQKKRRQASIGSMIESSKDGGNVMGRNKDIKRRAIQQELIDSAHVVCATLSGSGHDMFKNLSVEFETVIIDEAAQCIELSALIPLKYGCSKCILVGDPKQLPPTVLSKMAANYGYEQSLFVRMQKNHPKDIHLLDTQYRMHPEISQFPSQQFYDSKLLDGNDMSALRKQPWHSSPLLGPYRFFDVKGAQQRGQGHSLMNVAEIKVAMQLYKRLTSDYRGINWKGKVGIITPYKAQLQQLRRDFQETYGDGIFDQIEFNTTDAFQGREAEVIIFSCVRAQAGAGVGFLNDIRRMNVGLTRAKASLWVLGDSQSLMQGPYWKRLILDAQERGRYTDGNILSLLSKPSGDPQAATAPFNEEGTPSSGPQRASIPEVPIEDAMRRSSIQDIQMTDAPSFPGHQSYSTNSNGTAPATWQKGDIGQGRPGSRAFASGCSVCGATTHTAADCDNEEMLSHQTGCYRCHQPGHFSDSCTVPRCLQCGQFGHLVKYCTNEPLNFVAKRKIEASEAGFEKSKIQRLEKRKNYLTGGHDPKIPMIQATNPPPSMSGASGSDTSQNNNGKRRRAPSPSEDMMNKKTPMGSRQQTPSANSGLSIPTGPRNMTSQRSSSENSHSAPTGPRNMTDRRDSGSNGRGPSKENGRPPQQAPRKKKPVDPFIPKPKPRR